MEGVVKPARTITFVKAYLNDSGKFRKIYSAGTFITITFSDEINLTGEDVKFLLNQKNEVKGDGRTPDPI